jgi:chemotaxis protein CheD
MDYAMNKFENYYLLPGFIFFSETPYLIHTILGSCVSVCVWDYRRRYGGINHYMYARARESKRNGNYGDVSIPYLVHLLLGAGSKREHLFVHIVGGSNSLEFQSNVGGSNIQIADEIVHKLGLKVMSRDVGGTVGRRLVFNNDTGEIYVNKELVLRKEDWYS